MPMIDTKKDTGQFVRALVQLPPGKNLLAYGSMISWKDYMALWARILKLPGGFYKQLTIEDVDKMAPGGFGREVAEGWVAQGELGYDGGDPTVLHPKDVSTRDWLSDNTRADNVPCSLVSIFQRQVSTTTLKTRTGLPSWDKICWPENVSAKTGQFDLFVNSLDLL